jgi:hypothetical protein
MHDSFPYFCVFDHRLSKTQDIELIECIHEVWRYLKASSRRGIAAIDFRTTKK